MLVLLTSLAVSLLLTLLLELGFALLWSLRKPGLRAKRELLLVILVNCLTNPVVVLLSHTAAAHLRRGTPGIIFFLELAAVLVEWLCYRACSDSLRRPFWFSLCANLFSVLTGFILNALYLYFF